jgi:hypothetical protein
MKEITMRLMNTIGLATALMLSDGIAMAQSTGAGSTGAGSTAGSASVGGTQPGTTTGSATTPSTGAGSPNYNAGGAAAGANSQFNPSGNSLINPSPSGSTLTPNGAGR